MVKLKIKEDDCSHKNIEWDLKDGVEMLDEKTISIEIKCTDCGNPGHGYFGFKEVEWR